MYVPFCTLSQVDFTFAYRLRVLANESEQGERGDVLLVTRQMKIQLRREECEPVQKRTDTQILSL
jgi:hypothetical protein